MQTKVSFINSENLTPVTNLEELKRLIKLSKEKNEALSSLDLRGIDIINLDFNNCTLTDVLFNSFEADETNYKVIKNCSFKGANLTRVSFAHCNLVQCNFDKLEETKIEANKLDNQPKEVAQEDCETRLEEVDFFMCNFEFCRFRRTTINVADFRYSQFNDCSLGECKVTLGDFYMAAFRGTTNLTNSYFQKCSITNAIFEHDCIRIKGIDKLVQECYKEYNEIIIGHKNWHKQNPCADFSYMNEAEDKQKSRKSKAFIRHEASVVYANLSGFYGGKGLFRDSNIAYEKAKRNEAWSKVFTLADEFHKLFSNIKYLPKRALQSIFKRVDGKPASASNISERTWERVSLLQIIKCIFGLISFCLSWILGFGYKLRNVILCYIALVLSYTVVFHNNKGELVEKYQTDFSGLDEFGFSLNNSMSPHSIFTEAVGIFASSLETTFGILLIGFIGFVVANRIRNNF